MHVPTIVSAILTAISIVSVENEPLEIFTSVDWFDFFVCRWSIIYRNDHIDKGE